MWRLLKVLMKFDTRHKLQSYTKAKQITCRLNILQSLNYFCNCRQEKIVLCVTLSLSLC